MVIFLSPTSPINPGCCCWWQTLDGAGQSVSWRIFSRLTLTILSWSGPGLALSRWPGVGRVSAPGPGPEPSLIIGGRGQGCPGGSDHEGWKIRNNESQSFSMSDWTSLMIHFCDLLGYAGIWGGGLAGRGQLWHSLTLASLTLLSQILEQSSDVPRPVQWLLLTQCLSRVLS